MIGVSKGLNDVVYIAHTNSSAVIAVRPVENPVQHIAPPKDVYRYAQDISTRATWQSVGFSVHVHERLLGCSMAMAKTCILLLGLRLAMATPRIYRAGTGVHSIPIKQHEMVVPMPD